MKQILILYFCYFEPMSLWYTNFTRNSGTVKVQGQHHPLFLILSRSARRQYRTRYCTQYIVGSTYADSLALANSVAEGSVLLGPDYTELVPGRCEARAPSAEIGQKNILN